MARARTEGEGKEICGGDGGGARGVGRLPVPDKAFAAPDGEAESEDED